MELKNFDDKYLIDQIVRSDTGAVEELYSRYGRYVFSLALNIVGSREAAEEITQDVFTRVWEKARTYNAVRAAVSTWIMRITRNRSIDVLRQKKSRAGQDVEEWKNMYQHTLPQDEQPEIAAENNWKLLKVRLALSKLPKEQQEVLAFAYFKGYSHTEIADVLKEPVGTVKTRIRLAMQKLRRELSKEIMDGK